MEVEYKVEKNQEEKEQSVLPTQALRAHRRTLCNGPVSFQMSTSISDALDALFQRPAINKNSHPILQGVHLETEALGSRVLRSPGLLRVGYDSITASSPPRTWKPLLLGSRALGISRDLPRHRL